MEDGELVLVGMLLVQGVVVAEQPFIERMGTGVAVIEQDAAELRVVQEETAAEIEHLLAGTGHELVGEEGDMIACTAKQLGKKRSIAPLPFVADGMKREDVLKDKTGQVPRSHHVGKDDKAAVAQPLQLSGGRGVVVAIELRTVAVVALADDKDNLRSTEVAAVDDGPAHIALQGNDLPGGKPVGIQTERHAVSGQIEGGMLLGGQLVLHLADVVRRKQA